MGKLTARKLRMEKVPRKKEFLSLPYLRLFNSLELRIFSRSATIYIYPFPAFMLPKLKIRGGCRGGSDKNSYIIFIISSNYRCFNSLLEVI